MTGEDEEPTLNRVREMSREKLKGICTVNKVCDGAPGRFCQGQKFGKPIGLGGTGKGLAFTANVDALDRVRLKTRLIGPHFEPDMTTKLFGETLSIPVLPSSMSGVKASMGDCMAEVDFASAMLEGAADAGTLGMVGNTSDEGQELAGVEALKRVGHGILIFKPQANGRLIELMAMAEEAGAAAVGVDLDGVGSTHWERAGKPVFRKSVDDLRELVGATKLPFMAKGIMCVEDARDAVEAGVAAIDVSNHGGRALDATPGVAEVLPPIAEAVGGKVTVTAGGGVRTGFDVVKMLALGADAALVGRPMLRAALGGGPRGVKLHMDYLRSELRRGMLLTGSPDTGSIDDGVLDATAGT
jgi:isopentenyl diphosphate isomerase/L-lactate dehydrogenase-like FMN-dependent dehydrogenase